MGKYILTGVTKKAKAHLSNDDLESLEEMEGCILNIGIGDVLIMMPDGEKAHIDFLKVKPIY